MALVVTSVASCGIVPAGWSADVANTIGLFPLSIVVVPFVYAGVLWDMYGSLMFILNLAIFWVLFFLLWGFEYVFNWQRPATLVGACGLDPASANGWFYNLLNLYGFPEPLFITGIVFAVVFMVVEGKYFGRKYFPLLQSLLVVVYFVMYSIGEIALQRQTVGMWFANLGVATVVVLITVGYIYAIHPYVKWEDHLLHTFILRIRENAWLQRFEEYINREKFDDATRELRRHRKQLEKVYNVVPRGGGII